MERNSNLYSKYVISVDIIILISIFVYFLIYKEKFSLMVNMYINTPTYYMTDILLFVVLIFWFNSKKSNKYIYGPNKLINILSGILFIIVFRIGNILIKLNKS